MTERFDMVVIGGGPAGEKGAAQAAYWGKRVAVVDGSANPGGALVEGAMATKTLREAALYLTGFGRREAYGVSMNLEPQLAVDKVRSRAASVVLTMAALVQENLRRHDITLVRGRGRLQADRSVLVTARGGEADRVLEAPIVLIATGSRPLRPPEIPFNDSDVLDSDAAARIERPVRTAIVVGGGAVGCEYASILTALGTKVTLIDNSPRLLRFVDAEVAKVLGDAFESAGIDLVLNAGRAIVSRDKDGPAVTVNSGSYHADRVIFAGGRVGNTDGIGLEDAGVDLDDQGRVIVDEHFHTTAPGIYAAGDVIGPPALASVSMEQGRVAACHAFGIPFKERVDSLAPFGVYSVPEVAMVGLTEDAAREAGLDVESGRARLDTNSRAAIAGGTQGMIKLVFRRDDSRLVGVHIVADGATELIHQGQAVMHFDGTIDYFIHSTFNVPTVSEAYKYAAYDGLQRVGR